MDFSGRVIKMKTGTINIAPNPNLNIDKLNDSIEQITKHQDCSPRYLIMNVSTANDIGIQTRYAQINIYGDTYYAFYDDIKIAICNDMPYGEVEIVL